MSELKAGDKILQQMTRDGAVEVNKATGDVESISARDAPNASPGDSVIGGVIDRVKTERRAFKKKAVRKSNRKIFEGTQRKPETTRLTFSDAERGDPSMAKPIRKSDKAADRYDKARARIRKEKVLSVERVTVEPKKTPTDKLPPPQNRQGRDPGAAQADRNPAGRKKPQANITKSKSSPTKRVLDEPKGETKTRLVFRERDKPPNGRLTHAIDRPKREAALTVHDEIDNAGGDDTGIQAAHFSEKSAEGVARTAGYVHSKLKFEPQRQLYKAEEKAAKANVKAIYKRDLHTKPELENAGVFQKAAHKRKIKKEYAKALREGDLERVQKTADKIKKSAKKAKETTEKTVKFAVRHWKGLLIIGGALGALIILLSSFASCGSMFGGGFTGVIGSSYTAEDTDITGADGDYAALESELAARIARIESDYPGYNEYRFSLDEIGHDPHVLTSYLTAQFNMYTREQVQAELAALFAAQYRLTLTPVTEIRYRTETYTDSWTDEDGNTYSDTYTVEVPYYYYILNVSLTNRSLNTVALSNLTPEQAEMYLVYMETRGNKPELFADNPYANGGAYIVYDVPPEALSDTVFAAMLTEAEKHLGRGYVWGGSSPSTGFDCSGFVSWVVNHSGWSVGRLGAKGLFNVCAPVTAAEAKPGDLIFFWHTYDAPDPNAPTHVGIYVGGGYMIHCGNPISYADVNTPYWVNHFYSYARLP